MNTAGGAGAVRGGAAREAASGAFGRAWGACTLRCAPRADGGAPQGARDGFRACQDSLMKRPAAPMPPPMHMETTPFSRLRSRMW